MKVVPKRIIENVSSQIIEMLPYLNKEERVKIPISELTVALQCGGSDAYSGITANPALGHASDLIVKHGGSTILAETPEIYGAEHLLFERAGNAEIVKKLQKQIDWWRTLHDQLMREVWIIILHREIKKED